MWPERYVVYYSRDKRFAVRWLDHGRPESEAQFETFDDRDAAEQFFETLIKSQPEVPKTRIEMFVSEVKWVAMASNEDLLHKTPTGPFGHSTLCRAGEHHECADSDETALCTCWCHSPVAL